MAQITLRLHDEDLELLKAHAKIKTLRPLTYASYLLTASIRGHGSFGDLAKEWENLENKTQYVFACKSTGYEHSKVDPKEYSKDPKDIEERHGDGPDIDEKLRKLAPRIDITKGRGLK